MGSIGLDGIGFYGILWDFMGLDGIGLDGMGLDWMRLDGIGLDWMGLDGIGLELMGFDRIESIGWLVGWLVDGQARVDLRDMNGHSAADLAALHGHEVRAGWLTCLLNCSNGINGCLPGRLTERREPAACPLPE
jgi:hypothetical protein